MQKKVEVLQEGKNDCAAACLLSIIKYYNGRLELETIRNLINTNKNGTNAYDIIKGSNTLGFDTIGKKITVEELKNYESNLPVIAHIKKHNMYHFIVIYKIKGDKLIIMDPSVGLTKLNFKEFNEVFLGTILILSKTKELPKIRKENKLLKIIIKSLLSKKREVIILSLLSLVVFILLILDTIYYKIIFDTHILIIKYLILFISIIVLKNIMIFFRNKKTNKMEYSLSININTETLKNIFNLPYSYYKNKSTGEVISRINNLESLKNLLSDLILNSFVNILLLLISFTLIFIINKKLALIGLIVIIFNLLLVKIFNKYYLEKVRSLEEEKGYYNEILTESLNNIESINNLNIKEDRIEVLNNNYKKTEELTKKINNMYNIENTIKNTIYDIGLISILVFGMNMVNKGSIGLGDLMLLYMFISFFLNTIKELLNKHLELTYTLKNVERVNSLFLSGNEKSITNETINGDISIKNLTFNYGDVKVLNNKNYIIKEGDKVLITGKSGSGKSTLIKIILKYLTNYEGKILIGEEDLKTIDKSVINNSFNYIGQNENLFTDTFRNNIVLNRNITEEEYEKVINICELDKIRNKRRLKDDFLIEEGGFNLSGGERQRIILARALLRDTNYIIIDEALSEVNANLEKKIIENIFSYFKNKTIIYITHKDEIKRLFSKILNLERR